MPIHSMNFENGVFFARQVGYVDKIDGNMWSNAAKKYARTNDMPVVAVVDMREVDRLCPTLVKTFSGVLTTGNVLGIALIAGDSMTSRNDRVMTKLSELNGLRVFTSPEDGYTFARMQTNPSFGYSGRSLAYAAAF